LEGSAVWWRASISQSRAATIKDEPNLFRHKVFKMLLREKKIRGVVDKLLSWKNSGFSKFRNRYITTHKFCGRAIKRAIEPSKPN